MQLSMISFWLLKEGPEVKEIAIDYLTLSCPLKIKTSQIFSLLSFKWNSHQFFLEIIINQLYSPTTAGLLVSLPSFSCLSACMASTYLSVLRRSSI